jgi:23S rRNA (cytosine1962-C5)-methyltransferase
MSNHSPYSLIDSGDFEKLEQVGPYRMVRPCPQAVWPRRLPPADWTSVDAVYHRSEAGGGNWEYRTPLAPSWTAGLHGQPWQIKPTGFGHLGIFPEQQANWDWLHRQGEILGRDARALNLFAYTGGSTLALAHGGCKAVHVDAARGVVAWARENAKLQDIPETAVQWLVEDAMKFCQRELRRGRRYQGIVLDPPTFGRGPGGEMWKIEQDLVELLKVCRQLLEPDRPCFVLLSCHSPGFSPLVLENVASAVIGAPSSMDSGEMTIPEQDGTRTLPSGCFVRWMRS